MDTSPHKPPRGPGGPPGGPKFEPGRQFWLNLLITFLVLLAITSAFSYYTEHSKAAEPIPVTQVATDIIDNKVESLKVEGDQLTVIYKPQNNEAPIERISQIEPGAQITDVLSNLGVSGEQLRSIKLDIVQEGGFKYWFVTLGPIILPLLFFLILVWFLMRQIKGAGMQAFTFGQSKARMIDPSDTSQRITFKDVAGAKEAKEELTEIVDFLKNPKKFIDIGARIPKGVLLMGAPGTGKCVVGTTQILTNKGLIPIADVPKYFAVDPLGTVEGLTVTAVDPAHARLERTRASHWYALGEQDTIHLTTDTGQTIEGTHEHPVVVVDEASGEFAFKTLSSVREGEWLVTAQGTEVFGTWQALPHPHAAYLAGVLVGDGCLTIKDRVCLSTADPEVLDRAGAAAQLLWGAKWHKSASRPYDYEIRSIAAKRTLREWGLTDTYATYKRVPEAIRLGPREHVQAFLQGLFDSDGTVAKEGVSFSTASERLIEDVHLLLLNLGVVSRRYMRTKKVNGKRQYYLTVYGDFVPVFERVVGFTVARKRERLARLCERKRNTNVNVVPCQSTRISRVWRGAVQATHVRTDRAFYNQLLYKNTKRYMSGERIPSVGGLQTFVRGVCTLAPEVARTPDVAHLVALANGSFFFTRVKTITYGRAQVYDLTVPGHHNFVGNGFVNHNTLLARAVSGEANVPFFTISGSEFVELFVGVGASRVRDLFKMAKKAAPAIIFIDEIDAVGRVRGTGVGGGNDEREQTLNQILVEMDGFEPNEKLIIMAATNRPDVLDPALLRPGRFDRRVVIDLPDRDDRESILAVHARKKPLGEDVNLRTVAERTVGFSGADLQNLMNEAAILAARENRRKITQYDLIRSIEKVMLGPERKSHILSKHEKEITAYHEAGHALVGSILPNTDPVHKISIISRGRAAGYTLTLPFEDRRMQSRKQFLDDIAKSLGGYVAEEVVFGDLTTGASNDLQVLSALARNMVARWGMSEKLGPLAYDPDANRTMFGQGLGEREYSDKVAAEIDAEVARIINGAHRRAKEVITSHRKALDAIAKKLVEVETIEREDFEKILILHGIEPKQQDKESEIV